jgi:ribonuclease P protein component
VEDFFCTDHWITYLDCVFSYLVPRTDKGVGEYTTKVSSFSFPKTRRLTHRLEYERVKRNGITQRGKLLMLNAMPLENSGPWRAGFVTSSRLGGAVVRNRVRRRLREIVRRHQHELQQSIWFVIVARHEAATAGYGALEDEWLRLARRASILL